MSSYVRFAINFLSKYVQPHVDFFSELKLDLKKSGLRKTVEEYLSTSILTCLILFVVEVPVISFIFSLLGMGVLFSLIMSVTVSLCISIVFFILFINYPKFLISDKAKEIDRSLPFATIYLSTIASSRLPPHKILEIFSKFKEYGEINGEVKKMVTDMKAFGLNIYDSMDKAVDRSASNDFKELLWSMSSTLKAGGDLSVYLTEKSKTFLSNYRRKLNDFSHSLAVFLEVYLTAIVLGTIFFTILTSIMSGLGGMPVTNIVFIQFFLIFLFMPLISLAFIVLIKASSPGGA